MNKLDDLHTLKRLLMEFELPVSPILEYAIKEIESKLCVDESFANSDDDTSVVLSEYESVSFVSTKEGFQEYLHNTKAESTTRNYLYFIEKPIRTYITKLIGKKTDSVYSVTSSSSCRACIQKLKADDSFMADNLRWHNALTATLSCYLKFLEAVEFKDF